MSESHNMPFRLSRPVVGVLIIGALVLLLQVPVALIRNVIEERVETRNEALSDVIGTWGGPQSIVGPRLVIPYRERASHDSATPESSVVFASFLPASLSVDGELGTETLTRVLFTVPVYNARLSLRGRFEEPDLGALDLDPADLIWERATLVIEVSDPKSVGSRSSVSWDGGAVDLLPGTEPAGGDRPGIHSRVTVPVQGAVDFEVSLDLKGAEAIWFVPFSRNTRVRLVSNWSAPSFSGAWLPAERALQAGPLSRPRLPTAVDLE
jgi:inner membrane protein